MNDLIVKQEKPAEIVRQESGYMPVIVQMAGMENVDADKLMKLMELQERWEANEARKAFNVAFSDFKAEAVTIIKNTTVKDGPLKDKKYADLSGVVNVVTPVMSKHGLSHSWRLTKDELTWMEVTCTIKHILGHSESVSMGAAPDTGPGRNAIQARGSAKSYLERYTLLAATGMAASDTDDDGKGTGNSMPLEDFAQHIDNIEGAQTVESLQRVFAVAYLSAQKSKDQGAMKQIMSAKDKRKKELR